MASEETRAQRSISLAGGANATYHLQTPPTTTARSRTDHCHPATRSGLFDASRRLARGTLPAGARHLAGPPGERPERLVARFPACRLGDRSRFCTHRESIAPTRRAGLRLRRCRRSGTIPPEWGWQENAFNVYESEELTTSGKPAATVDISLSSLRYGPGRDAGAAILRAGSRRRAWPARGASGPTRRR